MTLGVRVYNDIMNPGKSYYSPVCLLSSELDVFCIYLKSGILLSLAGTLHPGARSLPARLSGLPGVRISLSIITNAGAKKAGGIKA